MPGWAIITPDDWEKYETEMEEMRKFWDEGWMDRLDSELANINA